MKNRIRMLAMASVVASLGMAVSAFACSDHDESASTSATDSVKLASAHAESADAAAAKNLANSRFKVEGIACSGCEKMISAKLQTMDGVKGVQFYNAKDSATKKNSHFLKVSFVPGSVTNDAILKAIASVGDHYKAVPIAN